MEELLHKYLNNELSDSERSDFEKKLKANPELASELSEYLAVIDALESYGETQKLRNILQGYHNKIYNNKPRKSLPTSRKYHFLRYAAITTVAASISLLIMMSYLFKTGFFDYGKKLDEYSELKNDINKISHEQQSIWDAFTKSEKNAITRYSGTCFAIASNGFFATSYHLVKHVDSVIISQVLDSLVTYKANIIYKDPKHDIAILKINDSMFSSFSSLPFLFSDHISPLGDYVFTLGFSKKDIVFGEGSISSLTGFNGDSSSYQISIPSNPGNSGGPLFDDLGNIIGIISGKNAQREETTYAIKSEFIQSVIDSVNSDTSIIEKPIMPKSNVIKWKKRTDKIQRILPFIFRVEGF